MNSHASIASSPASPKAASVSPLLALDHRLLIRVFSFACRSFKDACALRPVCTLFRLVADEHTEVSRHITLEPAQTATRSLSPMLELVCARQLHMTWSIDICNSFAGIESVPFASLRQLRILIMDGVPSATLIEHFANTLWPRQVQVVVRLSKEERQTLTFAQTQYRESVTHARIHLLKQLATRFPLINPLRLLCCLEVEMQHALLAHVLQLDNKVWAPRVKDFFFYAPQARSLLTAGLLRNDIGTFLTDFFAWGLVIDPDTDAEYVQNVVMQGLRGANLAPLRHLIALGYGDTLVRKRVFVTPEFDVLCLDLVRQSRMDMLERLTDFGYEVKKRLFAWSDFQLLVSELKAKGNAGIPALQRLQRLGLKVRIVHT